ncbi:DUF3450 domain-containing protein [Neptuniibacter sp. SY11_33]|uniref:DUF3450 domain-containing protein n=1 Tax=Neptuniibacter sp. SY11_33 TaxID=3398215 RepID=UPI0039F59FB6
MKSLFKYSLLAFAISGTPVFAANDLDVGTKKTVVTHNQSQQSQKRIDNIEQGTQVAVDEYLTNERLSDVTEAYNAQVALLIESQKKEVVDLEAQIASIEETDKAVLPMLNQMVETLGKFVAQDIPFLKSERKERLEKLETLLLRADVSVAEKYRQILEAYAVEVQYGRTFESYKGALASNNGQQVTFLRLGRAVLYYQSLSGSESALWQPSTQSWQVLNDSQNLELTKAIQIARQQQVPSLLNLPLPKLER